MPSADDTRYEFGENWTRFVNRNLNEERIQVAQKHLLDFMGRDDLKGLDFLDIGCGSGIHSLGAHLSGAGKIHSLDYDPNSVGATTMVREKVGNPDNWHVERGDVLDRAYIDSLGKWNFVYSWGVLHHTGDVWGAIDNAQSTVAPGGLFYVALYAEDVQTDPEFWLRVKKEYNEAGALKRWRMEWWYVWVYIMNRRIWKLPELVRRIVRHRLTRGMSMFADIRDWLGGWPMEFTKDKDVETFLAERGFKMTKIDAGEACTEFLFERTS